MRTRYLKNRYLSGEYISALYDRPVPNRVGDKYWSQVSLLVRGENKYTLGNTRNFVDVSSNSVAATAAGSTMAMSSFSPYFPIAVSGVEYNPDVHGGSIYIDANDYLTINNSATNLTELSNGSFTLETWIYLRSLPGAYKTIISINQDGSGYSSLQLGIAASNKLTLLAQESGAGAWSLSDTTTGIGTALAINTWYHVAVERVSGSANITVYLNGTSQGTYTLSSSTKALKPWSNTFTNKMSDSTGGYRLADANFGPTRLSKGIARYGSNFTPPSTAFTNDSYTAFAFNFGTTGVYDCSGKTYNMYAYGNATLSATTTKFNGASLAFDGSGDVYAIPFNSNLALGTGDACIEMWVYPNSAAGAYLIDIADSNSAGRLMIALMGSNNIQVQGTGGGAKYGSAANKVPNGQWTHVAWVRIAGKAALFFNGIQDTSLGWVADTTNYTCTTQGLGIGGAWANNGAWFNGYIDDLRITKGNGRYAYNFTPPTAPHSAFISSTEVDPYYSSNSLLTHAEGANNSGNPAILDSSGNTYTITTTGTPAVSCLNPFNGASNYEPTIHSGGIWFKGNTSNDSIKITEQVLTTGATDLTIEAWVMFTALPTANSYVGNGSWANNAVLFRQGNFIIMLGSNNLYITDTTTDTVLATPTWAVSTWYHIAVTKSGTSYKAYINGTLANSVTSSIAPGAASPIIGSFAQASQAVPSAIISNLRITESVVYTTSFSVPTAKLTPIANTKLLLLGNNVTFFDVNASTAMCHTADSKISNMVTRFGSGGLAFDGTGDWVTGYNPSGFIDMVGDFTIECWVYQTARGTSQYGDGIISLTRDGNAPGTALSGTAPGVLLRLSSSTNDTFNMYSNISGGTTVNSNASTTFPLNTWTHVAITKNAGVFKLFQNGTTMATSAAVTGYTSTTLKHIIIGASTDGTSPEFQGYIDEIRITKGVARYISDFVPPTNPFAAVN